MSDPIQLPLQTVGQDLILTRTLSVPTINASTVNISGSLLVSGQPIATATPFSSLNFKRLTGTISAGTPNNNTNNFTLSGFDSIFTSALGGTGINLPAGIYNVSFSTSLGQPITTTGVVSSQSYMYPAGTNYQSSEVTTSRTYPTGWLINSLNSQQLQTQIYFPVAGTLQFGFFNNLGATAGIISCIIVITCQTRL